MPARPTLPDVEPPRERLADGGAAVVRRAPFSDNPRVGARGQRTQQRILDAALGVIGDEGYHRASVDRIAKVAGCSRVAFYQYFASKEDVFRHLAGQVTRQISASTEALAPLTPDRAGWDALQTWVARYADVHARYEPIFHAYETDDVLAQVAESTGAEVVTRIQSRLVAATVSSRQLDATIRLLLQTLNHTLGTVAVLRAAGADGYSIGRVDSALTDVLHRTLFGVQRDVNARPPTGASPSALAFSSTMQTLLEQQDPEGDDTRSGGSNRALGALLTSGHEVFVERGYHQTRVDDLVAAAGVSHGAFYRYFENKGELARILAARAMRAAGTALRELPDVLEQEPASARVGLRRWLRRYHAVHLHEAEMLRVWTEAALQDPELGAEFAAPLDWGRRQLSRYLVARSFGDADMEALVFVGLLGVFGAQERSAAEVEAAAQVIEQGLLGRHP